MVAHHQLAPFEVRLYDAAEQFGAFILDANDVADARARLYAVASDESLMR